VEHLNVLAPILIFFYRTSHFIHCSRTDHQLRATWLAVTKQLHESGNNHWNCLHSQDTSFVPEYQKLCPWSISSGEVCKRPGAYHQDQAQLAIAWEEQGLISATANMNQTATTSDETPFTISADNKTVTVMLPKYASICRQFAFGNCQSQNDCHYIHDSDFREAILKVGVPARQARKADVFEKYKTHRLCHFYSSGVKCFKGDACYFIHDSSIRKLATEIISKYQ
jgi:hypothetical protein